MSDRRCWKPLHFDLLPSDSVDGVIDDSVGRGRVPPRYEVLKQDDEIVIGTDAVWFARSFRVR